MRLIFTVAKLTLNCVIGGVRLPISLVTVVEEGESKRKTPPRKKYVQASEKINLLN